MTPGERIKTLRAKNDLSQKQLSHDLGYKTHTTLYLEPYSYINK